MTNAIFTISLIATLAIAIVPACMDIGKIQPDSHICSAFHDPAQGHGNT